MKQTPETIKKPALTEDQRQALIDLVAAAAGYGVAVVASAYWKSLVKSSVIVPLEAVIKRSIEKLTAA